MHVTLKSIKASRNLQILGTRRAVASYDRITSRKHTEIKCHDRISSKHRQAREQQWQSNQCMTDPTLTRLQSTFVAALRAWVQHYDLHEQEIYRCILVMDLQRIA